MQDITYGDKSKLERCLYRKKIYDCYNYLFTFDGNYLVYERFTAKSISYSVLEYGAKAAVNLFRRKEVMAADEYGKLIEKIKHSDFYKITLPQNPMELIRYVFDILMPPHGFAVRENQIVLSQAMYSGMAQNRVAICEAEVGTGKTYAYLVAAVVFRLYTKSSLPITVTTSSIELQKSIIKDYIPTLSKILMDAKIIQSGLTSALRKGKEHYLCNLRYNDFMNTLKKSGSERNMQLHQKLTELHLPHKGIDLDAYPALKRHIAERINVPKDCRGNCPAAKNCGFLQYKENANAKEIVFQVCNHNYYLAGAVMEHLHNRGLIPPCSVVIIDEAHKLADAALQIFGTQLETAALTKLCKALMNLTGKIVYFKVDNSALCKRLTDCMDELLLSLIGNKPDIFEEVRQLPMSLTPAVQGKLTHLQTLLALAAAAGVKSPSLCNFINKFSETIDSFIENPEDIFWIEQEEIGSYTLHRVPQDLEQRLCKTLWQSSSAKTLTSGTLSDDRGFSYFKKQVGVDLLPPFRVPEMTMRSPFDYQQNSRLYISGHVPFPDRSSEHYLQSIADEVVALVQATAGHTAVLFTSYRLLMAIHERTAARISKYPIIKMDKSSKNTVDAFKKSGNGVLFASGTFWEGVDCSGDILSSVIIVNLPFPVPTPILEHRKKGYEVLNDFIEDVVFPEMLIKLRQGIGRLIRNETDTGLVAILDYRAGTHGKYKDRIAAALPQYPRIETVDQIADWFREVKQTSYFEPLTDKEVCG